MRHLLVLLVYVYIALQNDVQAQEKGTNCYLEHIDRLSLQYQWKIPFYCERILLHNTSLTDDDGAFLLNAIEVQHNHRDEQKRLKGIKVLDLSWNQLGLKTAQILSNLVFTYTPLTHMYIGHNTFREGSLKLIIDAIGRRRSENLFHVDLSGLSFSDSLVSDLVRAVEVNSLFIYLSLNGCDISWEGIDKLKKAVEARREKGVPIEVERGSGAVEFFNYPFTKKSRPFNFDSKVHMRSIFNVPSVIESTGSIKDCFNAIGRNPAIFDEYGIDDHDGADKLSESDIVALLPVDIER